MVRGFRRKTNTKMGNNIPHFWAKNYPFLENFYLPAGQSRRHSEQAVEPVRKELHANLFIAYCSPAWGSAKASAGQLSMQILQLTHVSGVLPRVGSSTASVRQQASRTLGPKSGVISRLCLPILPNPAAWAACLNENTASRNRAS